MYFNTSNVNNKQYISDCNLEHYKYFNTSNVNNKQDFLEKRKQKKEYFNTSNVNNKPIFYKWICYNFPISIHQMLIINAI